MDSQAEAGTAAQIGSLRVRRQSTDPRSSGTARRAMALGQMVRIGGDPVVTALQISIGPKMC